MAFTLVALATMLGMDAKAEETPVVIELDRRLQAGVAASARATQLEARLKEADELRNLGGAELLAARREAELLAVDKQRLEADLKAALKAQAEEPAPMEPAPESAPKYKVGDKVLMDGQEGVVKEHIGLEHCYRLEDGRCACESMMEPVSAEVAAKAADATAALTATAKRQASKMTESELKALGVSYATGKITLAQAFDQLSTRPAVKAQVLRGMKPDPARGQVTNPGVATLRGGQLIQA